MAVESANERMLRSRSLLSVNAQSCPQILVLPAEHEPSQGFEEAEFLDLLAVLAFLLHNDELTCSILHPVHGVALFPLLP